MSIINFLHLNIMGDLQRLYVVVEGKPTIFRIIYSEIVGFFINFLGGNYV